jgi:hypothetical protein
MEQIVAFAKAHGFAAMANTNGREVVIAIPTYNRHTDVSDFVFETVRDMRGARLALGY